MSAAVFALGAKVIVMRRAAEEICGEFSEKLEEDTNTLISVSTGEKSMCRLADRINVLLRDLRVKRQRFEQGDRELKSAVANISHDLRTPLTAITSYLELLEKTEQSGEARRCLEIIKKRTDELSRLTEELFQYSVITLPGQDAKMQPVWVNQVLEESILDFYALLREKNITPDIHITSKKVVRDLDPGYLSRIFTNLLNNAVKYSEGDLYIALRDDGEILFSNTASAMSKVQAERLFDRFYTLEGARKSTGLGLSIARVLTERMHGTITAQYGEGRLSVRLLLPERKKIFKKICKNLTLFSISETLY